MDSCERNMRVDVTEFMLTQLQAGGGCFDVGVCCAGWTVLCTKRILPFCEYGLEDL